MSTGLVIAINGVVLVGLAVGVLLLLRMAERKGFTSASWVRRSGDAPPPPETDDEWHWQAPTPDPSLKGGEREGNGSHVRLPPH